MYSIKVCKLVLKESLSVCLKKKRLRKNAWQFSNHSFCKWLYSSDVIMNWDRAARRKTALFHSKHQVRYTKLWLNKKIPRVSSRLVLPEFYPHFFLSHFFNLTYNPLFHAVTMMLGNLSLSKIHNFPTNFTLLCSSSWQCLSHAVYSTRTLSWHTWKKSTWESKVLNQTRQKHWKGLVFFSLWGPHP